MIPALPVFHFFLVSFFFPMYYLSFRNQQSALLILFAAAQPTVQGRKRVALLVWVTTVIFLSLYTLKRGITCYLLKTIYVGVKRVTFFKKIVCVKITQQEFSHKNLRKSKVFFKFHGAFGFFENVKKMEELRAP